MNEAVVPSRITDLPDLATPSEVASVLRCRARTVQNECRVGRIAYTRIAGRYLISREAVYDYLKERTVPCQSGTKAPTLTGGKTEKSGRFDGSIVAVDARVQRALQTAAKLKPSSRNIS